jgi:hypothetical protein
MRVGRDFLPSLDHPYPSQLVGSPSHSRHFNVEFLETRDLPPPNVVREKLNCEGVAGSNLATMNALERAA